MMELEVKLLNVDLDKIEKLLISKGAKLFAEENQLNRIIDTEDNKIRTSVPGYMRIRSYKDFISGEQKNLLTLKVKHITPGIRSYEEIETEISDVESTVSIFEHLGYKIINQNAKHRKSYSYEDVRFDLDEWDEEMGLNPYLEIEVPYKERLDEIIEEFGFDRKNISTKSIRDIVSEQNEK